MNSANDASAPDENVRASQDASAHNSPVADVTSTDDRSNEAAETAPLDEPQSPDNGQTPDEQIAPASTEGVASFDDGSYTVDAVNDEPVREQSADVEVNDELTTLDRSDNLQSESGADIVAGPEIHDDETVEDLSQVASDEPDDEEAAYSDDEYESLGDDESEVEVESLSDDESEGDDYSSEEDEYTEEYAEDEESDESEDGPAGPSTRGERLQKILAAAGVDSRRQCEELITSGRVEVNGEIVTTLGARAIPGQDDIRVDGTAIKVAPKIYYAINKPKNVLCTTHDPSGRARVVDLLPNVQQRLFTVGRLDKDSEGLLIVTNDGELAQRLMHPKFGVEKTYKVQIAGVPEREVLQSLLDGVRLAEGLARAQSVKLLSTQRNSAWLEIVLTEGRNREIRRILAKVGHKVMQLQRIAVGTIRLKLMAPGEYRRLTQEEVSALWKGSSEKRKRRPPMKTVQGKFRAQPNRLNEEGAQGEDFESRPRRDRGEMRARRERPAFGAGEGQGFEGRREAPRKPNADGGFVAPGRKLGFMRPSEDSESGEDESTLMRFARRGRRPQDDSAAAEGAEGEQAEGGSRRDWKMRPGHNFHKKRFGEQQTGEYNSQKDAAERAEAEAAREARRQGRESGEGSPYQKRPFGARGGEGRPQGGRTGEGKPFFKKRPFDSAGPGSERAPYKKPFGARKPWQGGQGGQGGQGEGGGEGRPFKKRSFGDRPQVGNFEGGGEGKPFFSKRPYASRVEEGEGQGERRPYGNKPFGAKKPFGARKPFGQQGGFGQQGDRPFFKKRREEGEGFSGGDGGGFGGGEGRPPYGKKPFGARKPWQGGQGEGGGEGRPFNKKPFGARKPWQGGQGGQGEGGGEGRPFFKKRREEGAGGEGGEGRPFFKKRSFGGGEGGGGFGGGEGRPPYGKKPFGARKPWQGGQAAGGGEGRPFFKKRREDGEGGPPAGGGEGRPFFKKRPLGSSEGGGGFGGGAGASGEGGGEGRPFKKSFGGGPRKFGKPGGFGGKPGGFGGKPGGRPFKKRKFEG